MPSLNVDLDYFDHPKTKRLVGLLGRGSDVLPIRLWAYCGKYHAVDGRLTGYAAQEIESIVGWWGQKGEMMPAMLRCGFAELDGDTYVIHDWVEHQGHIEAYKQRAKIANAARRAKVIASCSNAVSGAVSPLQAELKQSSCSTGNAGQGNKPRARGSPKDEMPDIPDPLKTPEFERAWGDLAKHRQQKRSTFTPLAAEKLLAKCEKWGPVKSVRLIDHAITNNWTGVFDPEENGRPAPAVRSSVGMREDN
jgi:hypothetical protein